MSDDVGSRLGAFGAATIFGAISVLIATDIVMDTHEGAQLSHLVVEAAILLTALIGFGVMIWRTRRLRRALRQARADASHWRDQNRTLVKGLGAAIHQQFSAWGLSDAEAEVGLLLLKGLSLQHIADLRKTSERTVREQARAIYRKGDLAGRNELSAYFLEDLLPDLEP
ncbi:MAG: LuxR family transcriptional regulator [Acidobacteria bacterium]|nr:LuxR family transcriptional regulator [Acidobacteriota bacterium]